MANPILICIFNPVTRLIDVTTAASIAPGIAGAPVVLNAQGLIDPTLLNAGTTAVVANGTSVAPGMLVSLFDNAGTLTLAPATAGMTAAASPVPAGPLPAMGYVLSSGSGGDTVTVYLSGLFPYSDTFNEFAASNLGASVYLRTDSSTPTGRITLAKPSGSGQLEQAVGLVTGFDAGIVTVNFNSSFQDFGMDFVNQAAAISATTLLAVTSAGLYAISWVASVTQASDGSSTLGGANGFQVIYTDNDDSHTKTSLPSPTSTANSTGTCLSGVVVVNAKASSNIQFTMGYTDSHTTTGMRFNLHCRVESI